MFLGKFYATEIMTPQASLGVLVLYIALMIAGIYGASQMELNFSFEDMIDKEHFVWKYVENNWQYWPRTQGFSVYVENNETDYSSIEFQVQ